jgi:hypothetical protein
MSQDGEPAKPPPMPKLFKILCCPVNTKTGRAIVDSLAFPYHENEEDKNIIIGRPTIRQARS